MRSIWNKEIVVKRTIGGYVISNIVITIFISLITFLELVFGIKFLLGLNLSALVDMQNEASAVSDLALSISGSIMLYILPLIIIYMAVITVLMVAYELNKNYRGHIVEIPAVEETKPKAKKKKKAKKSN